MITHFRCLVLATLFLPTFQTAVSAITRTAAGDGNWSASATWSPAGVPAAGDDVVIPNGRRVVYDSPSTTVINSVKIQGLLQFSTGVDTNLSVNLLIVGADNTATAPQTGQLVIGTSTNPIPRGRSAVIQLADVAGNSDSDHPAIFVHGGRISMHGAALANPWTRLASGASSGATTITVADSISDWQVGDRIIVVACRNGKGSFSDNTQSYRNNAMVPETEERTITAISSKTITLNAPLTYNHTANNGNLTEVANLTRTITVKSASAASNASRGHTLIGKFSSGSLRYVRFDQLGKEAVLGRYPVHIHMAENTTRGFLVEGCAVTNSNNKFYVVHRSNYITLRNNVGYRCFASGYFLEDATETYNVLERNLSVLAMNGTAASNEALGFLSGAGWGFWWANGRNSLINNTAAECDDHGFKFEIRKLRRYYSTTYASDTVLSAPCLKEDGTTANTTVKTIRLYRFDNNRCHAAKEWAFGFTGGDWSNTDPSILRGNQAWTSHYPLEVRSSGLSIHDFKTWNSNYGIKLLWNTDAGYNYVSNVTFFSPLLHTSVIRTELGLVGTNVNFIDPTWQDTRGGIQLPFRAGSLGFTSNITFVNYNDVAGSNGTGDPAVHLLSGDSNSSGQMAFAWFNNWFAANSAAKVKDTAKSAADGLTYSVNSELNGTSTHSATAANYTGYSLPDETDRLRPHSMITSLEGTPAAQHGVSVTRGTNGSVTISGSSSDDRDVAEVRVNGMLATTSSDWLRWSVTLSDLPAGANTFTSVAKDSSGKAEITGHSVTVTLQ